MGQYASENGEIQINKYHVKIEVNSFSHLMTLLSINCWSCVLSSVFQLEKEERNSWVKEARFI